MLFSSQLRLLQLRKKVIVLDLTQSRTAYRLAYQETIATLEGYARMAATVSTLAGVVRESFAAPRATSASGLPGRISGWATTALKAYSLFKQFSPSRPKTSASPPPHE